MKYQYSYAFPRPSVTATIALFVQSTWNSNVDSVILGRRGRKDGAYSGFLCLPGGFLDAKVDTKDVIELTDDSIFFNYDEETAEHKALLKAGETVEETAIREIFEETGLVITKDRLELAHVHSDPLTDPRAHVVNVCYFVVLKAEEAEKAVAGDDLEELVHEDVWTVHEHTLAFNHNELYAKMLDAVNVKYPESDDE